MAEDFEIVILDEKDGSLIGRCTGPAADGSCPRVAVGELVPCAGTELVSLGGGEDRPYDVPGTMTVCPVTLANMLAVSSDAPFGLSS